jgi:hypothetical protein
MAATVAEYEAFRVTLTVLITVFVVVVVTVDWRRGRRGSQSCGAVKGTQAQGMIQEM